MYCTLFRTNSAQDTCRHRGRLQTRYANQSSCCTTLPSIWPSFPRTSRKPCGARILPGVISSFTADIRYHILCGIMVTAHLLKHEILAIPAGPSPQRAACTEETGARSLGCSPAPTAFHGPPGRARVCQPQHADAGREGRSRRLDGHLRLGSLRLRNGGSARRPRGRRRRPGRALPRRGTPSSTYPHGPSEAIERQGTDQNAAIHLYTHERACPEARSARGRGVSNSARARQRPWISAVSARADSRAA